MRDWSTIPVDEPMDADQWDDLLLDLEHSEPDTDKHSAARWELAKRLARLEELTAQLARR